MVINNKFSFYYSKKGQYVFILYNKFSRLIGSAVYETQLITLLSISLNGVEA